MLYEKAEDEWRIIVKRKNDEITLLKEKLKAVDEPTEGKGGWISVKDRLPEYGQVVLVVECGFEPMICKYENRFNRHIWNVPGDIIMSTYLKDIDFWQPLPDTSKLNND